MRARYLLTQLLKLLRHGDTLVEIIKHNLVLGEEELIAVVVPSISLLSSLGLLRRLLLDIAGSPGVIDAQVG